MDTDSFVYNIKTDNFYKHIVNDVDARFDTSGYSCSCPFPKGVNKKGIRLMIEELGWQIMTEFVALRLKLCPFNLEESWDDPFIYF